MPIIVEVSPRGRERHVVRVKVNRSHGTRMTVANATVAVGPLSRLVTGRSPPSDEQAIFQWFKLNADAVVAY